MEVLDNDLQKEAPKGLEIWDNSERAKTVLIVFWILNGLTVVGIISGYFELELLQKFKSTGIIDDNEATNSDIRQAVLGVIQTGMYITSVVVFLNWFRRAYANLYRLGIPNLKYQETMSVWSWFIPILSLFRPVQIMGEIWTKTQEKIISLDATYKPYYGGPLTGFWWALFIVSNIAGRLLFDTLFKVDTVDQLIEGSQAMMVLDIIQIVEAFLVIGIVTQLSKIENKLALEIKKAEGNIVFKK